MTGESGARATLVHLVNNVLLHSPLDNILTVPRHRLKRLMGACDAGKIEELNQAIKIALDVR